VLDLPGNRCCKYFSIPLNSLFEAKGIADNIVHATRKREGLVLATLLQFLS
jgi:hypothetical protein